MANRTITMTSGADAAWRGLYAYCMEKGDRWQAESLLLAVKRGCLAVQGLARIARERLREPLAVVLYDAEWQTLTLFGEQGSVCANIQGQAPQDAAAALDGLVGAYISRVVEYVGLGVAPWDWDGRAPWERQAI